MEVMAVGREEEEQAHVISSKELFNREGSARAARAGGGKVDAD